MCVCLGVKGEKMLAEKVVEIIKREEREQRDEDGPGLLVFERKEQLLFLSL